MIVYLLIFCRCNFQNALLFTRNSKNCQTIEEKVELDEKRLLITFQKKRVIKWTIARYNAVIMGFLNLWRSDCKYAHLYTNFWKNCQNSKKKCNSMENVCQLLHGEGDLEHVL